jgi:hypothetical protein
MIKGPVDAFLVYAFIKRLVTPFDKWDAFKTGVIDKDGNVIVPPLKRTKEQIASFGMYDVMILNMKKLLAKIPGGSTRFATYSAALYLVVEPKPLLKEEQFTDFVNGLELTEDILKIYEDAPTNNIGGGQIATYEKPISKKIIRRKRVKNVRSNSNHK